MRTLNAQSLLLRADNLGIFPAAALRVRDVASSSRTSAVDLEQAIGSDQALASRMLKLANSPFYGARRAATLREAIVRIGFVATRDLATALALSTMCDLPAVRHQKMWGHALRTGFTARRIATLVPGSNPETSFVAGLLHEMGSLLMLACDTEAYDQILSQGAHSPRLMILELERYKCDHAELAAECATRWNFDPSVIQAIRYHHRPDAVSGNEAWIVSLADQIAVLHQAGGSPAAIASSLGQSDGARRLNLSTRVETLVQDVDRELKNFEKWSEGTMVL
jgi:HD-like signal output (HDOD) protein